MTFTTLYTRSACLSILSLLPLASWAQGTLADYQRAERLNGAFQNKVCDAPERVQWQADGRSFWYAKRTANGNEFVRVEVAGQAKRPAFDQARLAQSLGAVTGKPMGAYQLPVDGVTLEAGEVSFKIKDSTFTCSLDTYACRLREVAKPAGSRYWGESDGEREEGRLVPSPDGKQVAYIRNHNVYVRPATGSTPETALSSDGSAGDYYSGRIMWSPDSKRLAATRIHPDDPHKLYLIESSPTDQLQPRLQSRTYRKPGDALPLRTPVLFSLDGKSPVAVPAALVDNQYNVTTPQWRKDGRAFTFEYNQRGHQRYTVFEMNTAGAMKSLIEESSPTFIQYSGKNYRYDVSDGRELIWASERDGWNHLYLYDGTGRLKNQITKGPWVVRKVLHVDEANRTILFEGSGREAGQDPYLIQLYRVNFDGSGLTALTRENANHRLFFSPDYQYVVDCYSRVDTPQKTVLRQTNTGKVLMDLETADINPLLATGWQMPEVFSSVGRDGKTDIWGIIVRPSNFDPAKTYPVIEYIYAGPHDSFVPKNFVTDSRGSLHEMAELGFIVVQIDGMGTANRSKAFQDVCWKDLKDSGFPDRMAWLRAAAKRYPYMDLNRVGIWGNSAGGQSSAGALLHHPDFYKVAVSSSGCHDNRMDKMWWNEQWMGYPVGPHYAESSNVTDAHKLQGKLLLILGELDDNVDPSSTYQFINALIKANKNFDFLMVPGMGHSLGGDYGEHKRRDFFVKHLLNVEPPAWTWAQQITVPKP
ncbi:prolyl oligopeptidase family serine peptidase [Spirosoma rhododendri]|uniref:Prolyl oligopeptidase family serine peptidase n=1 Tax=Spirosoma rhododendri TaxID=2728024 RepID=A0A7L5DKV1_9BACT|nr:S9 family peptidase [Spirosoma rhododendri]QJD77028.1 prolyl oligopeptidase family serine peptidase [Spirosoma rhododendri]